MVPSFNTVLSYNTLRLRQNDRRFSDIFKCIFLNENVRISNTIWLKFITKGSIQNNTALVQIMAWCRTGHYLNQWWLVYWYMYPSLSLNEFRVGDRQTKEHSIRLPCGVFWGKKWSCYKQIKKFNCITLITKTGCSAVIWLQITIIHRTVIRPTACTVV